MVSKPFSALPFFPSQCSAAKAPKHAIATAQPVPAAHVLTAATWTPRSVRKAAPKNAVLKSKRAPIPTQPSLARTARTASTAVLVVLLRTPPLALTVLQAPKHALTAKTAPSVPIAKPDQATPLDSSRMMILRPAFERVFSCEVTTLLKHYGSTPDHTR